MPHISPKFEEPHHPHHDEEVEPEKPSHDAYLRWLIGGGVFVVIFAAIVALGSWWTAFVLFTFLSMPTALVLTVIFVCMLFRGTLMKAGPFALIVWSLIALYGWFAILVWIGQSAWGWTVF